MSRPIIYDITPEPDGWRLGQRGGGEPTTDFPTREEAIREAEVRARRHDEARLVIRTPDGRIEEDRSVRAADPRRIPE